MMDSKKINSIKPILNDINIKLKIPILFILGGDCKSDHLNTILLQKNYKKQLDNIVNHMNVERMPSAVLIKEGFLE
jgi:hypothetical protein